MLNSRDMYLRPDVYRAAEEQLKVILAVTLKSVENGMDIETAIKESHIKIYQSANPSFAAEVQFSIDICYRDVPAVEIAMYNRARKLIYDAYEVFEGLQ